MPQNQSFSRGDLLDELKDIEARDVKLSLDLDMSDIPLAIESSKFLRDEGSACKLDLARFAAASVHNVNKEREVGIQIEEAHAPKISVMRQIRNFSFIAATLTLLLSGAFFVYKGFGTKDKGIERGLAAYESLKSAEENLRNLNFYEAGDDFSKAYENLASAEGAIEEVGKLTVSIAKNIPFSSGAQSSIELLRATKHIAKAGEVLSSALGGISENGDVFPNSALTMASFTDRDHAYKKENLYIFIEKISFAESEVNLARMSMENVNTNDFPEEFRDRIFDLNRKIPILAGVLGTFKDYANLSSYILGFDESKRYLVLFQNSSELRPTGGFIGSYGVVEVHQGEFKNIFVDGIYNIDGQLTVNVVPPKPLQHITTGWSTHDANWFLDFPTSAQKIMWFFEKTGSGKVDGVISFNVEVVEQLLSLTGPIHLDKYDIDLDSKNFRDEIQYEVEVAYDKKLNRPKQVLSDFTPIFLERLSEVSGTKSKEIASIFIKSLAEKNIMFYFANAIVQEFFEKQGWAGKIQNSDSEIRNDYLAVIHVNIGGHKTDKYMEDALNYNAKIEDDGSIIGNLTVTRTHKGGDTPYWWYNRQNIDYMKIYVPNGAQVVSYSGGKRREVEKPADYTALHFEEDSDILTSEQDTKSAGPVDIFVESGKTVFGTWLVTKPGTSSVFKIFYRLPFKVEFKNGAGKYNLYLEKQPGTSVKTEMNIDVPDNMAVVWGNSGTNSRRNFFTLDKDRVLGYILQK